MIPTEDPIVESVEPKAEKVSTEIHAPIIEILRKEGDPVVKKGVSKRVKKL